MLQNECCAKRRNRAYIIVHNDGQLVEESIDLHGLDAGNAHFAEILLEDSKRIPIGAIGRWLDLRLIGFVPAVSPCGKGLLAGCLGGKIGFLVQAEGVDLIQQFRLAWRREASPPPCAVIIPAIHNGGKPCAAGQSLDIPLAGTAFTRHGNSPHFRPYAWKGRHQGLW